MAACEQSCTALHCTALHCTTLHCPLDWPQIPAGRLAANLPIRQVVPRTLLWSYDHHPTALHCTALHCTALHCVILQCSAVQCRAVDRTQVALGLRTDKSLTQLAVT